MPPSGRETRPLRNEPARNDSRDPKVQVLDMAKKLDTERQKNRLRGPFHGLRTIVKVYLEPFAAIGPSLIAQPGCSQH